MRIGIDISQVIFSGTGSATYTAELLTHLLATDKENEYVLFGGSLRRHDELKTFTRSLTSPVTEKFTHLPPSALHFLWNKLHKVSVDHFIGQLDIFHASDATQPPTKAKKVTTIHDLVVYTYPETLHPAQVRVQKRRLAWVKKEADAVIAVSEATKQDILTYLQIDPEKITVIYEGVTSQFSANLRLDQQQKIEAIKTKYQLPEQYLLNVGTLQPRKNLTRLLEAYKQLSHAPALAIVGNVGWGEQLPKVPGVTLLGAVEQQDLPYLYAGAYFFIYPSLYEGFGLPILEAMACGTPVITSNVSSLPEVGGDAALYVDPKDVDNIRDVLEAAIQMDHTAYHYMEEKSLNQAKNFSWNTTAEQTLALYRKILNTKY